MGQARLTNTNHYNNWPDFLQKASDAVVLDAATGDKPVIIRMDGKKSAQDFQKLVQSEAVTAIVDNYDEQLAELFISKNAQLYKANAAVKASSIQDFLAEHYNGAQEWQKGSWVYYPWSGQLVHILEEELFIELRTIRNRDLLTNEEQQKFHDFRVGCAGMSVGSNGAQAIALTGGSHQLKLADGAVLSGSNLNRLRTSIASVGLPKCQVVARQLYELNPYLEIATFGNITRDSIDQFFADPWPLDMIVDEIDDVLIKVLLRLEAKKRRIPLVMVTEPGNDAIVDVERYDLDPEQEIFNGKAPGIEELLTRTTPPNQREFIKYFNQIVGVNNLSIRDQKSMVKVGSELASPPQLGSTAMMTGGIIGYLARQIAIGAPLASGRHIISLDKVLMPATDTWQARREHRKHSSSMIRAMKSM